MKYKVGDVLLLRVTVDRVDETDCVLSYRSNVDGRMSTGTWFGDSQVFAVVSKAEEPVEEKRLEVGEWVTVKARPDFGVAKIEIDDRGSFPFMVRFSDGESHWYKQDQLTRAEAPKPEPELKVGDWVTSRDYREWGAGQIIEVDNQKSLAFNVRYSNGEERRNSKYYLTKAEASKPQALFKVGDRVIHRNAPHWGVGVVTEVDVNKKYSNSDIVEQNDADRSESLREIGNFYMVRYPTSEGRPSGRLWQSLERFLVKAIE
jgi:hypothetical protein